MQPRSWRNQRRIKREVAGHECPRAILPCDTAETGMDFVDALHLTRSAPTSAFVTFDQRLAKRAQISGIQTPVERLPWALSPVRQGPATSLHSPHDHAAPEWSGRSSADFFQSEKFHRPIDGQIACAG